MTEENKKELLDKVVDLNISQFYCFKEPIKVKGTRDGILNNIDLLTNFIKDNNNWYMDDFNYKGSLYDIYIIKFDDKQMEEVEEIPQEGVCLLSIQDGDILK